MISFLSNLNMLSFPLSSQAISSQLISSQMINTQQMGIESLLGDLIEAKPITTSGPFVWPPAIGWWILAAITLALLVFTVVFIKRRLQKRKLQAFLLNAFSDIMPIDNNASPELQLQYVHQLNKALKSIALYKFGTQAAQLNNQEWLAFLDETGKCNHFTQGSGQVFGSDLYRKEIPNMPDPDHLMTLAKQWCEEVCA